MIPKKIHYCWFGGASLPEVAIKCMNSWKRYCPDYEIIRWDESNCDLSINKFVEEAYKEKKWAFVSDYYRLKVVEENGGIYLDIDVELLKPLDDLLDLDGFMGFELGKEKVIATGLGFGAIAHHPIITALRENYEKIPFIKKNGQFDMLPCPQRDTKILVSYGLIKNNKKQTIQGITFFPSDYFSPVGFMGERNFSDNTYSIHHFNSSWFTERQRNLIERKIKANRFFGGFLGSKISLFLLAWDEIKYSGLKSLMNKLINRKHK